MSRPPLFASIAHLLGALIIATSAAYIHVARPFPNSPPVTVADSYTVHGHAVLGLLLNDSDPDGNPIFFYDVVSPPAHGTVTVTGSPLYRGFTAHNGYVGSDSFTYRISDNQGGISTPATVTINIVNNAPVPNNDSYTVHGQTTVGPMLVNDSDPDGDSISFYDVVTWPTHGNLQPSTNPASKYYTPQYGYVGPDSFTYRIKDNLGLISGTATVTLNVVNNPPAPKADFYIAISAVSTSVGPLRENDSDPDGDSISFPDVVVQPSNGTANPTVNPDFKSYKSNAGFTGTDSFQYRLTDSLGQTTNGTVYVLVLPSGLLPPKVPYARCPSDPGCLEFNPGSGGLSSATGGPAGSSGPSWPDPVNLATGRETFAPSPDLQIYNPTGPGVSWGAHYFADQALKVAAGYGSPGLTRGWVHNYDIRVQGTAGSWGALTLHYSNGSTEILTPVLSGGVPTGAFNTVAGAPYFVTGVSGSPTGTWQSVTITWKDQTKWKFTQHNSTTTYALNQITNRTGQSLNFTWNSSRALTQVSDAGSSTFTRKTRTRVQRPMEATTTGTITTARSISIPVMRFLIQMLRARNPRQSQSRFLIRYRLSPRGLLNREEYLGA